MTRKNVPEPLFKRDLEAENRDIAVSDLMIAIKLDVKPSMPTRLAFGIATRGHFEAIAESVKAGEIGREQLLEAFGDATRSPPS